MALTLGDNFSYQGAKPLDARLIYSTVASMKAVADATMYDGCLAYCVATDKTYQWKSTNTVDANTGKWREFTSGGGSSVVSGYYKEADHLFYEESTYTTPIAGAANTIYISVDTNKSYRYNSSIFVRIDEEEGQIVQIATLPTASADNLGKIYEYTGATGTYTNGLFYKCVFDGTNYSWAVVDVVDTLSASDVTDVKNAFSVSPSQYGSSGIVIDKRGNEYPVGEVIDAQGNKKTLWQKYVNFGKGPGVKATKTLAIGISNLEEIFSMRGYFNDSNGNAFDVNRLYINGSSFAIEGGAVLFTNNGNFTIRTSGTADMSSLDIHIFVQYTKTT